MFVKKSPKKLSIPFASVFSAIVFSTSAVELPKVQSSMPHTALLSFEQAIKSAQKNDPWLTGNEHKQRAIESLSISAYTLPDPKVSLGFANLPTDGFDFGQEGMTQAKIGISQQFPRGDSLSIRSQQLKIESEAFPYQRRNRAAKVAVSVGSLWLDIYQVQQSIILIKQNRSLYEQLVDGVMAHYSSSLGKARQQDIVLAHVEQTKLDDRLAQFEQLEARYTGMLSQWLTDLSFNKANLSNQLPQVELLNHDLVYGDQWFQPEELISSFSSHPSVAAIDKQVYATKTGVKLAKQKYQPEWRVNASYGYRGDDPMGASRADLFSIGVTFDLPLFTKNRQDQDVQSAISQTEAVKTEKTLLLRQLVSGFASAKARLLGLQARQVLYTSKLLPQMHDQAEVSLSAYNNDEGNFTEVVRAQIALLNTEIDQLSLNVEEQKIRLELNYFFVGSLDTNISSDKMKEKQIILTNSSINTSINTRIYTNSNTDLLGEKQ